MRHMVVFVLTALVLSACVPSALLAPGATAVPSPDLKATEAKMTSNVFATLTAAAPSVTPVPPKPTLAPATAIPEPTQTPFVITATPVLPTNTPVPIAKPTTAPTKKPLSELETKCQNTPSEKACLWIHNYRGANDLIRITINKQQFDIPPGGDLILYVPPGSYPYNAAIVGRRSGLTEVIECPEAGKYYEYHFW